ncbi:MAG: polysaccharide biosynthesis/export family protein [Pseudomonadota bacterium]
MGYLRRLAFALAMAAACAGCAHMPASGPSAEAVQRASANENEFPFLLFPVDKDVITALRARDAAGLASAMSQQARPALRQLGVGDLVSVTIWEATSGGLFASAGARMTGGVASGANAITIPPQRVDAEGYISVPYAGLIQAANRRPDQVSRQIVAALRGRAIEPQALVTVEGLISNQATVLGDAVGGGRIALIGPDERILDVIAAAGGVTAPIYSVAVRLTRGAQTAETPLSSVIADPRENIIVQPGDVITLYRDPLTFTAFGATGQSTLASFDADELMLDEALGKVGGVIDARGDPAGVFVFRYEPIEMVEALSPAATLHVGGSGRPMVPVAYQIDMRDPVGLFYARSFPMRNKDVLFVANAEASELRKVLGLVGAVLSPASTGAALSRVAN